jgi:hypothetical protein
LGSVDSPIIDPSDAGASAPQARKARMAVFLQIWSVPLRPSTRLCGSFDALALGRASQPMAPWEQATE